MIHLIVYHPDPVLVFQPRVCQLERRDAVKETQRALGAMRKKESDKASLLHNLLITDTARARILLEGHDKQLAESEVSFFVGDVA